MPFLVAWTRALESGGEACKSLADAVLRAAGLRARWQPPRKSALQHRAATTSRVPRPQVEEPQRPHAPFEGRGECTPGAFPVRRRYHKPGGLSLLFGHNLGSYSAWPEGALYLACLPGSWNLVRVSGFARCPSSQETTWLDTRAWVLTFVPRKYSKFQVFLWVSTLRVP